MPEPSAQQRPSPDQQAGELASVLAAGVVGYGTGAAVAGVGAGLVGYWTANAAVLAGLTRLYVRWGYRREVTRWVLRTVVEIAPGGPSPSTPTPVRQGPAQAATARASRTFAAWFLQRSADRIQTRLEAGMSPVDAQGPEDRYVEQHLNAQARRRKAAERVDAEVNKPGQVVLPEGPDEDGMGSRDRVVLKWRAHPDDRTTPECAAADGAWFYADTPPIIGYPGMPHGGTCRCWPANAGSVDEVVRGRTVDEAVRAIIGGEPDHRDHPGSDDGLEDERQTA